MTKDEEFALRIYECDDISTLKELLAVPGVDPDGHRVKGMSRLGRESLNGHRDAILALLAAGANPNLPDDVMGCLHFSVGVIIPIW